MHKPLPAFQTVVSSLGGPESTEIWEPVNHVVHTRQVATTGCTDYNKTCKTLSCEGTSLPAVPEAKQVKPSRGGLYY